MYAVYINNTDVTDDVDRKSLSIKEQLNNRKNTASFSLLNDSVASENQEVEIYLYNPIVSASSTTITLDYKNHEDNFEYEKRFYIGQTIIVGIKNQNEKAEIQNINYTTGIITLISSLSGTFAKGDKVGIKTYGGYIDKIPDENIGKSDILTKKVSCVDYSYRFAKENVVGTYEEMYAREIISRFVYNFTDRDFEETLANFESSESWTASGIATAAAFSTENIQGNNSLKLGATGAGAGGYNITISSIDVSSYDNIRFFLKTPGNITNLLNSLTLKIGTDSSNYYYFTKTFTYGDLWSWEDFDLNTPSGTVGSPDISAVTWLAIDFDAITAFSSGELLSDIMQTTSGGFTLQNVERGEVEYEDLRVQYKRSDELIEQLAKLESSFWYIDYDKDIHFFSATSRENTRFSISSTSNNYNNLKRKVDVSQLKNRQTIRGGLAPAEGSYTQEREVDGVEESWSLDYSPKNLTVEIDTGGGYISASVGVENLVDESTVDYVYNFSEKTLRKASAATLAKGNKIRFTYTPYKDIRVRYQDIESINRVKAIIGGNGVFDGAVINDESIRSFADARSRAQAEIEAYKNPIVTIIFETETENIQTGELIQITDTTRGIDDKFLVQSVSKKSKDLDAFVNNVVVASTMFGYIEFFQLIFRRTEKGLVDVNELVDIIQNIDEVLSIDEDYTLTIKSNIFYAMGATPGLTPNDAYADFSEVS